MDRQHAQRVLLTYRLGETAPPGSELAEALALAEGDEQLSAWLEAQLRADRVLRAGLRSVPVPPGLRDAILAGRPPIAVRWTSRPVAWMSLAALIALVVGISLMKSGPISPSRSVAGTNAPALPGAALREQMAAFLAEGRYALQAQSASLRELRDFVGTQGGARDAAVPSPVAALNSFGCQVFKWEGHTATLICFTSPRLGFVHLIALDAPPAPGIGEQPVLAQSNGWNTAVWGRGGRSYFLCARGSDAELRVLLGS